MGENSKIEWTDHTKMKARAAINYQVRTKERPHPNVLPCTDCGHEWSEGERRHEYDHYLGYAAEHHYSVQPVCTICHAHRTTPRPTQCASGHEFTEKNTKFRKNGTRECRQCRRGRERKTRTAEWWRARRARKAVQHGTAHIN